MPSIIKNRLSSAAVNSFLAEYGLGSSGNLLYMGIGRDAAWPSSDTAITTPTDKFGSASNGTDGETEYHVYTSVHALVQIPLANVQPVVPRVDWTSGQTYNPIQLGTADAHTATNWYVLNSSSQVWKCITGDLNADGTDATGTTSTVEPFAASPTLGQSSGVLADNYEWEYVYTISGIASNALTSSWMPVNYSTAITGADNPASLFEMQVRHMMLVGEFGSNITIDGGLTDDQFRQVGIWDNPVQSDGSTAITAAEVNDPQTAVFTGSGIDANFGKLMYQENRAAVTRSASQIEQIKVVIEF